MTATIIAAKLRALGVPNGTADVARLESGYYNGQMVRDAVEYLIKVADINGPDGFNPLEHLAIAVLRASIGDVPKQPTVPGYEEV